MVGMFLAQLDCFGRSIYTELGEYKQRYASVGVVTRVARDAVFTVWVCAMWWRGVEEFFALTVVSRSRVEYRILVAYSSPGDTGALVCVIGARVRPCCCPKRRGPASAYACVSKGYQ